MPAATNAHPLQPTRVHTSILKPFNHLLGPAQAESSHSSFASRRVVSYWLVVGDKVTIYEPISIWDDDMGFR